LEVAIETVLDERRAMVVWVHGPPGIGKTRLRLELERRLRERRVAVLTGRGESHRRDAAFHAMASVLRSHPELEPVFLDAGASVERRRRAIDEVLVRTLEDPAWARHSAEPVARLLGLPDAMDSEVTRRHGDPQLMSDRVRISIADFVGALSARAPLALVVDDAQWADDASLLLLDELVGRLSRRPLLVFLAARSE